MKKFLSLVLALVMTMSLVTISAGAEDFTDADDITYVEAVEVLTAIGVVDGDTAGNFNPTNGLTRGAAAKIICNLILGPTTAAALDADTNPYPDVDKDSVFAGYIAYCQKEGIISGYADGSFKPAAPLTSYAFMKMLLGALGYDAEIEGYTGANWSINVAKQALAIGLDTGLVTDLVGTKAVTREEAMLYAFNMLQADLVEYDDKTNISIGDATIEVGGGKCKSVTWQSSSVSDGNIDGIDFTDNNGNRYVGDGFVQFAELYFNKLEKLPGVAEAFSRPANTWRWKGVNVGTYAETPDVVYTASVAPNTIYADLGMVQKDRSADLYIDGVLKATNIEVSKAADVKLHKLNNEAYAEIGNGTIIEVFLDTDNNHVDICAISVYGGRIAATRAATDSADAYVVVDPGTNAPSYVDANGTTRAFGYNNTDRFETDLFEEDEVVAYTFSEKNGYEGIKSMYTMESVTGNLARRVVGTSITLEGSDPIKYAEKYTFDGISETSLSNKSSYVVYTDENGYALWIEEDEFVVDQFALVRKITDSASGWVGNKAELLFADGTIKTVDLDADYISGNNGQVTAGKDPVGQWDVVAFRVNDKGQYVLKTQNDNAMTDGEKMEQNGTFGVKDKALVGMTSASADSKTVFVVNTSADNYKVYTGIKNAPTIGAANQQGVWVGDATAYAYAKDGVAKVIFTVGGTVSNTSKDITFIAATSAPAVTKSDDSDDYYVYNAVVAGEITTVMLESTSTFTGANGDALTAGQAKAVNGNNEYAGLLLNVIVEDGDSILQSNSGWSSLDVTVKYATGIKSLIADGEVRFGNSTYTTLTVSNNVQVYEISTVGGITEIDMDTIVTDGNDKIIYTMEDGEVTNIFIQVVK